MTTPDLATSLRALRDGGRKLLVPYITGGYPGWQEAIRACAANGADAVEIGIPFSDPVMDGPVIQQASQAALEGGTTPQSVLEEVPSLDVDIPLAVMTYYNLVHHDGPIRFATGSWRPVSPVRFCRIFHWKSQTNGRLPQMMLGWRRSCSLRRPLLMIDYLESLSEREVLCIRSGCSESPESATPLPKPQQRLPSG